MRHLRVGRAHVVLQIHAREVVVLLRSSLPSTDPGAARTHAVLVQRLCESSIAMASPSASRAAFRCPCRPSRSTTGPRTCQMVSAGIPALLAADIVAIPVADGQSASRFTRVRPGCSGISSRTCRPAVLEGDNRPANSRCHDIVSRNSKLVCHGFGLGTSRRRADDPSPAAATCHRRQPHQLERDLRDAVADEPAARERRSRRDRGVRGDGLAAGGHGPGAKKIAEDRRASCWPRTSGPIGNGRATSPRGVPAIVNFGQPIARGARLLNRR
jgi:hypothetical protein